MRIATPEGVDVELTLAGIGSRFIAAILDFMIQGRDPARRRVRARRGRRRRRRAAASASPCLSIVFFLVFFGYDVLFEVRSRGRTPGKRWTGLRVVRTGGQPVTFVPSCVRNVMRLVDILPPAAVRGRDDLDLRHRQEPAPRRPRRAARWSCASGPAASRRPARRARRRPRRGGVGRQRGVGAGHRHRAPVPRPPRRRSAAARARARRASSSGGCARASPARPSSLSAEEFLERLSAAKT